MNKFAKGSLAAGAGIVLLLGGAGTLAYWNSEVGLSGGTINAGELTLTAPEGEWAPNIETWVPGDEAVYTTDLTLVASGDNIQGTIELEEDSVVVTGDDADEFDIVFAPQADSLPAGVTYDEGSKSFAFDGPTGEAGSTIPVQVTVTLPFGEAAENRSQGAQVDMSSAKFIATQTAVGASN